MDNSLYSDLAAKKKLKIGQKKGAYGLSLAELASSGANLTSTEVIRAFCHDFRQLLDLEQVTELAEGILTIEQHLAHASRSLAPGEEREIPAFKDFYLHLAPTMLRVFLETPEYKDAENKDSGKIWKEALRVALEEELYIWKNKLIEQ